MMSALLSLISNKFFCLHSVCSIIREFLPPRHKLRTLSCTLLSSITCRFEGFSTLIVLLRFDFFVCKGRVRGHRTRTQQVYTKNLHAIRVVFTAIGFCINPCCLKQPLTLLCYLHIKSFKNRVFTNNSRLWKIFFHKTANK